MDADIGIESHVALSQLQRQGRYKSEADAPRCQQVGSGYMAAVKPPENPRDVQTSAASPVGWPGVTSSAQRA
jgi:hypothetical protein